MDGDEVSTTARLEGASSIPPFFNATLASLLRCYACSRYRIPSCTVSTWGIIATRGQGHSRSEKRDARDNSSSFKLVECVRCSTGVHGYTHVLPYTYSCRHTRKALSFKKYEPFQCN